MSQVRGRWGEARRCEARRCEAVRLGSQLRARRTDQWCLVRPGHSHVPSCACLCCEPLRGSSRRWSCGASPIVCRPAGQVCGWHGSHARHSSSSWRGGMASHGMAPAQQRIEPSFSLSGGPWLGQGRHGRAGRDSQPLPAPSSSPTPRPRPTVGGLSSSQGSTASSPGGRRYDLELAGTKSPGRCLKQSDSGRIVKADSAIPRHKGCTSWPRLAGGPCLSSDPHRSQGLIAIPAGIQWCLRPVWLLNSVPGAGPWSMMPQRDGREQIG